ncbi:hypothetical protein Terro_0387 [Terriglobus roseus DSM 18391]|uniref:Uncharacterized protein n=2 Tax=Terriglobus roseus TaxID=392734 RepID=I3ZBW8_TERRK|nr:hypothetical protein Terro_0387 [Terriglobus roseus DSM 18391]
MAALSFLLHALKRHAVTRFALSAVLSLTVLPSGTPARAQGLPVVVPGTLAQASTSSGACFTLHQCGDGGPLSAASFVQPDDMAFDRSGNLFIVDASDVRVRKITKGAGPLRDGIVTPFVGQSRTKCPSPTAPCGDGGLVSDPSVLLNGPRSIAFNAAGDLFIADFNDNRVRRVDHATSIITTYAGNGTTGFFNPVSIEGLSATQVGIQPKEVALAPDGTLYIANGVSDGPILAVDPTTGRIRTYAGSASGCTGCDNVPAIQANIGWPSGMSVDANGDLYFVDISNHVVRKVTKSTGLITTIAGAGSNFPYNTVQLAKDTEFISPEDLLILPSGDLLVDDSGVGAGQIFRIEMSTGRLYPIAGCSGLVNTCDPTSTVATRGRIDTRRMAIDAQGNIFYTSQAVEKPIYEVENTPATIRFADTALNVRSSDSPETVYLMNFGAGALPLAAGTPGVPSTYTPLLTTTTPGASNSFTLDAGGTAADTVTAACPAAVASPSAIPSGTTCRFNVVFQSTATGSITGQLSIAYDGSNPAGSQQIVPLNGRTTAATATTNATVAAKTITYSAASVTLSASLTYSETIAPSGAVTFQVSSGAAVTATCTGAASPLTCTASYATSTLVAGSYPIAFHVAADGTYAATDATATLTVDKTTATVTLGSLTATYDGNPHAATVVTSPAGLVVSVSYDGAPTPPSAAGSYSVSALVTDPNYTGSATGSLVISAQTASSITFNVPPHTFGDADFNVSAASNSPGTFTYQLISGPATISGTTVHLTGAGNVTLRASQAASGSYSATTKTATTTVARATPIIRWPAPAAVAYATPLGAAQLNATATGIGGAALPGSFTYTPPAGSVAVEVPVQTLHVVFTPSDTGNYNIAAASVSLPISSAVLVVTANAATRLYGTANPALTGTITGQQNGDTFTETFSTNATTTSNAGTYAIVPAAAGPNLGLYTQQIRGAALTITRAPVRITAVSSVVSPAAGQSFTLTVTVLSTTTGIPTGTVQFLDNGNPIGTATLSGTQAIVTSSVTSAGPHVISLAYSGDVNFLPLTNTDKTFTGGSQDFALTLLSAPTSSFHVGESGSYQLRIAPLTGQSLAADVNLSYSADLPSYAVGQFSAVKVNAGSGATDITFSLVTTKRALREDLTRRAAEIAVALSIPLVLFRRCRALRGASLVAMMVALLFLSATLSGCSTRYSYIGSTVPIVIKAQSNDGIVHTLTIEAKVLQTGQ